jgi:hypothetical protein
MDRSSPSAAESASSVSAALDRRAAEMSADIYGLIVREIPQLRSDKRVLALLESSVAENVGTVLHILQHDIDMEKVRAPAAAEEYARRLAQRGVPIAALLRAYRIGSARFEDWCLQELGRQTDNASIVSAAGVSPGSWLLTSTRYQKSSYPPMSRRRRTGSGTRARPARRASAPCSEASRWT